MATRSKKSYVNIPVEEAGLRLGEIITEGTKAPIEKLIAAKVILEDQAAQCKAAAEALDRSIHGLSFDDIRSTLVDRGIMFDAAATPVVEVSTKLGDLIKVTISETEESGFDISGMKDKSVIETLVPEKYKKVSVSLDAKAIEADYDAGTLPDALKSYCSKAPARVIKLRKSISKKGE